MDRMSDEKMTSRRSARRRVSSGASDRRSTRSTRPTRATRKRATRKVSSPAPKVSPAKPAEERVKTSERSDDRTQRKAPTQIASGKVSRKQKQKQKLIFGLFIVLGIGASAVIGYKDEGQIDVQKTIEERNDRIRNNQADESDVQYSNVVVPVRNTSQKADGGLIGVPSEPKPVPAPVVATTSASSTEEMASSTEAVIDENSTSTEAEVIEEESEEAEDLPPEKTTSEEPVS